MCDFSLSWLKGEVRENLGHFRKSIQILMFLSTLLHVSLPFTKWMCCTMIFKGCNQWVWNKIVNIKPCMGQISGTWELILCEYWRKKVWLLAKKYWLERNFAFLQKLGNFIETKAIKSPTLPGLVSPDDWVERSTFMSFIRHWRIQGEGSGGSNPLFFLKICKNDVKITENYTKICLFLFLNPTLFKLL